MSVYVACVGRRLEQAGQLGTSHGLRQVTGRTNKYAFGTRNSIRQSEDNSKHVENPHKTILRQFLNNSICLGICVFHAFSKWKLLEEFKGFQFLNSRISINASRYTNFQAMGLFRNCLIIVLCSFCSISWLTPASFLEIVVRNRSCAVWSL